MTKRYLLEKADECRQAADACLDPIKRERLTILEQLWLNLANESLLIDDQLAEQITMIEEIHADLVPTIMADAHTSASEATPRLVGAA